MTSALYRVRIFLGLIVILSLAQTGLAEKRPCAHAEGLHALDEADTIRSSIPS